MADFNKFLKDSLSKAGELTKNVNLNELASKSGELLNNTTKSISSTAGNVIMLQLKKHKN